MTALRRSVVEGRTHRLIASRWPTVGVFDDLTSDPDDLRVAFLLESATNDRLAMLSRRIALLPDSEIVQAEPGKGATLLMAAFLHATETGGRFTDGRLGAWYASLDVDTAIDETVHHGDRRLRLSENAFPSNIQMRELIAAVNCALVDIRGEQSSRPGLYAPDDYISSQAFGVRLRWPASGTGENGITYDSVRRQGGTNVCIFRPTLVPLPILQGDHYEYRWDSRGHVFVDKLTNVRS